MSPREPNAQSNFTVEADTFFAASVAAQIIGDPGIVTEKLHSDVDRTWYRSTSPHHRSVLIVAMEGRLLFDAGGGVGSRERAAPTLRLRTRRYCTRSTSPSEQTELEWPSRTPAGFLLGGALKNVEWESNSFLGHKLEIACNIAGALRLIHESGLIHGDVRPENCFLTKSGEIALTGFGRAGRATNSLMSSSGTPAYMSLKKPAGQIATLTSVAISTA